MHGQNPFYNPEPLIYRNKHYVKQYLATPAVLILAILQTIAIVLSLLSSVFSAANSEAFSNAMASIMQDSFGENVNFSVSTSTSLPLLSAAFGVCFFLLYFCARSKKENSAVKGSVTFFWVLSIIQLVGNCLISALFVLLIFVMLLIIPSTMYLLNTYSYQQSIYDAESASVADIFTIVMIIFFVIMAAIVAFILFFSINHLRFAASVRKSVSTPELSSKGAKGTGVAYVIASVFSAVGLLFGAIIFFAAFFIPEVNHINSNATFGKDALLSIGASCLISYFINLANYVYMAKFAFGYRKHIDTAGPGGSYLPIPVMQINSAPAQTYYQPAPAQPVTGAVTQEQNSYPAPTADFALATEAEPSLCAEPAAESVTDIHEDAESESTNTPDASQNEFPRFCSNCGVPTVKGQFFCSNCGTKTV